MAKKKKAAKKATKKKATKKAARKKKQVLYDSVRNLKPSVKTGGFLFLEEFDH